MISKDIIRRIHEFYPNPRMDFFDKEKAASKMLAAKTKILSLSLIVRNTLCLGCARLLGGERQNDQHDHVRNHIVEIGRQS